MKHLISGIIAIGALTVCAPVSGDEISETASPFAPGETTDFTFMSSEQQLSGVFDAPEGDGADALILFVHGYGETNVRAWNTFSDLRQRFNEVGIATAVWDKPGQGQSEGEFDINQSVYSSAQEVVDAAKLLREMEAPGADKIGIWGVSRAGWIAPIAISQDGDIDFWISVSGTTAEDNFAYLLLSNLPHEGGTSELSQQLADEWRAGCEVFRTGGSFDRYQEATQTLRANAYIKQMRGEWQTRVQYEGQQQQCDAGACPNLDQDMCSYIFINEFDEMLSSLDLDVLAIFGEKDLNVDWRKTRAFYQDTIGQNPSATLAIETYSDADHNLHVAETGSIREMQSMTAPTKADGYYEAQTAWLKAHVLQSSDAD